MKYGAIEIGQIAVHYLVLSSLEVLTLLLRKFVEIYKRVTV